MSKARVATLGVLIASAILSGCASKAGPSTGNKTETCQNSICPQGAGAYKFCTAPGASSCRYVGSDGTAYACTSCSNCQDAVQKVTQWCAAQASASTGGTTGTSGGDCTSCSTAAQASGGACSTEVSACQADSGCATLASCISACTDSTCQTNCSNAAPSASQTALDAVYSCICSSCSSQCTAECGGGTTGSTGGATGGTTGAATSCDTCQQGVLATGAACEASLNACSADAKCSGLITCINACAVGDTACEQGCATTAGQAAVTKFQAIGDCICTNCATECSSQCAPAGGTTGGGTTGGGTTGGGTTGGGTTGGGTTGGGSAQACSDCEGVASTGSCQTAWDTCNGSPACVSTFNCANACTYGDSACIATCKSGRSSTTVSRYNAVASCLCTMACTNECGGILPQCTP